MNAATGFASLLVLRVGTFASPPRLLAVWAERRRCRRDLLHLLRVGPYLIEDVGLTVAETEEEAGKPFWRA